MNSLSLVKINDSGLVLEGDTVIPAGESVRQHCSALIKRFPLRVMQDGNSIFIFRAEAKTADKVFVGVNKGMNSYGKLELFLAEADLNWNMKQPVFKKNNGLVLKITLGLQSLDKNIMQFIESTKNQVVKVTASVQEYNSEEYGHGNYYQLKSINKVL